MNRRGAVLVVVLLAVLALELVAMSALGVARLAQLGAVHARSRAELQGTAEDALAHAAASLRAEDVIGHPPGSTWPLAASSGDAVASAVHARRLAGGLVLLEASAVAHGRRAAAAAMLRIIPPDSILAGFPAVVNTTLPAPLAAAPPIAGACPEGRAPDTRPSYTLLAAEDTLPFGSAAAIRWEHAETMQAVDSASASPPAALPQFVAVAGDTTIDAEFEGVLVVRGALRIRAGAGLRGLAAVRGFLVLEPGAALHGAARAHAIEDQGGTVAWDRCAVEAALRVAALQRAYRAGTRWRLPAF